MGESVKIVHELQEMTQSELARLMAIPQSTISAIKSNNVNLGVERAKVLARALRCRPTMLVFPGWDIHKPSSAKRVSAAGTSELFLRSQTAFH
ncbi:MAG: transcriptional regulator, XRE family [Nitrospira sp.]|nr:transcriptional regulator, XRE family [Nitrospira sp.]